MELISEYELELRSLPFAMEENQVIYIESEYNPKVNEFLRRNYWEVRQIFSKELLEFVYIPAEYAHAMEEGPVSKEWLSSKVPACREFIAQRKPELKTEEVFEKDAIIDPIGPSCICNGMGYAMGKSLYFDAYHLNIMDWQGDSTLTLQFTQIAKAYSRRKGRKYEDEFNDHEIRSMLYEMERLQRALQLKGVCPEVFDEMTRSLSKVSPLVVKADGKIILPDFNNLELQMNPTRKTLYLLILSHPEGIHPDAIVGHWHELVRIYSKLTHFDDPDQIESVVATLCNEGKTSLYSNVSHLRKDMVRLLGSNKAANYAITREADKLYHIALDRSLVVWEDEAWKVR